MTPLHRDVVGNHGGRGRVGGFDGGGGPWMGLRPMTPLHRGVVGLAATMGGFTPALLRGPLGLGWGCAP